MISPENDLIIMLAVFLAFVGPCLGSFASAIAYRIPRGQSWISEPQGGGATRSACPNCGYRLRVLDLIPIFSWIMLRGKCRQCRKPISVLYPALEITALILSLLLLQAWGAGASLFVAVAALPFIMAQMIIIWQARPQGQIEALSVQLLGILTGLGAVMLITEIAEQAWLGAVLIEKISGAVALGLFGLIIGGLRRLLGRAQISLTSAGIRLLMWLLGMIGLWLGIKMLPAFLIIAGLTGVFLAILNAVLKRPAVNVMPGAYLLSFLIILVAGQQIMSLLIF